MSIKLFTYLYKMSTINTCSNSITKTNNIISNNIIYLLISLLYLSLSACSVNKHKLNRKDPLEPINRVSYQVNKTLDALYLNPVVQIYTKLLPSSFRQLITNFFNNVAEVPAIFNLLLQARPNDAIHTVARLSLNSTLGIGGLFDVAGKYGKLPIIKTDFGVTLYTWGYQKSTYIVLPLLGPSTIRDGLGLGINNFISPHRYLKPKYRNIYQLTYLISKKYDLKELQSLLAVVGVDEYILLRNSYLQNRNYNLGIDDLEEDQG